VEGGTYEEGNQHLPSVGPGLGRWFTLEGTGGRVMKVDFLIALLPAFVGAVWLASDWFDV
jgi:hypothetical protein